MYMRRLLVITPLLMLIGVFLLGVILFENREGYIDRIYNSRLQECALQNELRAGLRDQGVAIKTFLQISATAREETADATDNPEIRETNIIAAKNLRDLRERITIPVNINCQQVIKK